MGHTPLGEVCASLGLLRPEDVDSVLARVREGQRTRFGEVALELGLLDEEGLARALAHQFRLNMVPAERLSRLHVTSDVLALLPAGMIRERTLVPTFLDEERRVLSLLIADPTDIPSLRAAQTAARAARLRLFVAARGGLRDLIERVLPPETDAPTGVAAGTDTVHGQPSGITVVFEPDVERASALRRLEALEGGGAEIVGDPEQVSAFIEANQADRVFLRQAVAVQVEPYLPAWRRVRPALQVCALDGYGTSARSAIAYAAARDFLFGALLDLLRLGLPAERRAAAGSAAALARRMAGILRLPDELADAVWLAGVLAEASELLDPASPDHARLRELAMRAGIARAPYDVAGLLAAWARRVRGEESPGRNLGAEVLLTARAAAAAGLDKPDLVLERLGGEATRHDADALRALTLALREPFADMGGVLVHAEAGLPVPQISRGAGVVMAGALRALPLLELLQTFTLSGRTAEVRVLGRAAAGGVQVRDGRIVAAWDGALAGDPAFFSLCATDDGTFEVRFADGGRADVASGTDFLFVEAARRRDTRA